MHLWKEPLMPRVRHSDDPQVAAALRAGQKALEDAGRHPRASDAAERHMAKVSHHLAAVDARIKHLDKTKDR